MASALRTTSRLWQVVQVMENKAFSTVPPAVKVQTPPQGLPTDMIPTFLIVR